MKNMLSLLLVLSLFATIGCGGGQHAAVPEGNQSQDGGRDDPGGDNGDGSNDSGSGGSAEFPSGTTIELKIASGAVMGQFLKRSHNFPLDQAISARLNFEVTDIASGSRETFGGFVRVGYYEPTAKAGETQFKKAAFESGMSIFEAQHNEWVSIGGKAVFKGFFEDHAGALLIVIDRTDDLGLMAGTVYFHNFRETIYPKQPAPNGRCWFVRIGPYDCRDFLTGSGDDDDKSVNMLAAIHPYRKNSDGSEFYVKLGTFEGLDGNKVFGN